MKSSERLSASLIVVLVAGCLISLLSFGARSAFGLYTDPLSREMGWGRDVYSMAIALQNLFWGIAQPFSGMIADKWGSRRVLIGGCLLYAAGIVMMIFADTPMMFYLSAGVLVGIGMGGGSYVTVVATLGRLMPETHRSWALGLGTAAGSLGQFVIVPIAQAVLDVGGWQTSAWMLAGSVMLAMLIAFFITGDSPQNKASAGPSISPLKAIALAAKNPSYVLLGTGFFVCGFQLAFITMHFPAYLVDEGLSAQVASWAVAFIGLMNVAGAYGAGWLGSRFSKKNLLAYLYFGRGALTVAFILLPVTGATAIVFGAGMGLLWLSAVPLTSGLVATFFGVKHMATLFGLIFFSHQIGSFTGVYLGGALYQQTGSYDIVWWLSVALSAIAGVMSLPIREAPSKTLPGAVPA
jgi:MFS family permease